MASLSRLLTALLALLCLTWSGGALAGTLTVEVLDVGQGDSVLITTPGGKRVLIDASIRSADVLGQLRARGVEQLDLVIATHPHADHIGGMADVLQGLPVRFYTDNGLPHTTQVYSQVMDAVEARGITYRPARRGQSFSLDDGARLEILFPTETALRNTRSDLNSNSVVARLTHGESCFLFAGDAEDPTEQALMQAGIEPCAVLKVAHHGSEHSTSAAWLRAVQPRIALISAGVDNRYGHPDPEAVARLESAGVEIYRTDLQGTLLVTSDQRELQVLPQGKDQAPMAAAGRSPATAAVAGVRTGGATPGIGGGVALRPELPAQPAALAALDAAGPAAPADGVDPACAYVASRNSKVYHPAACHVVARIYTDNRVCFATPEAAQATGRTRSASCPELGM